MILALDLSTKSSGYAIYDNDTLVTYGCIKASSPDVIRRIHTITDEICGDDGLIKKYNITEIVAEDVIPSHGENSHIQKVLLWLQASIMFMIHDYYPYITTQYLYPSEWRKVCGIGTGRGIKRESLKQKDMEFVHNHFGIDTNDDEADAISIGYSYIQSKKESH